MLIYVIIYVILFKCHGKYLPTLKSCAFEACTDAIEESEDGVYMPKIIGPTIPLPLLPKLGYKMIPLGRNWSYGVVALIFAAIEYRRWGDSTEK